MADLRAGGFTVEADDADSEQFAQPPTREPGAGIVWRGADGFVRRCDAAGWYRAFNRRWVGLQLVLACVGVIAVTLTTRRQGLELHARPAQIPAVIALGLFAVSFHEFGHALVTVHYGRAVRMAGFRLHLGAPAFYVESADALLLSRRQRLIQAAAGPFAEWLVTSLIAILFLLQSPTSSTALVLHRFVIVNTLGIASNLVPFVGLDGALLFADAVREPDLPFRSRGAVWSLTRPGANRYLAAYSAANTIVATGLLIMSAFFWWQLFGGLVMHLWQMGAAGVAILALLTMAATAKGRRAVVRTSSFTRANISWILSRLVFRFECRWRVQAITALRAVPEIAELDETSLGILAGRLQRQCRRDGVAASTCGYAYVLRVARRHRAACHSPVKGQVLELTASTAQYIGTGAQLVLLPMGWQRYLATGPVSP
jgi:hypothetical protein